LKQRAIGKVLGDLLDATAMAADLVARGRDAFDRDEMLRLAGEAILGRIGDAAAKLFAHFGDELPGGIPWSEIVGNRILVDHAYHRIDYDVVWATLEQDVPVLRDAMRSWASQRELDSGTEG
jgi:uncharacterized protein with HEPN domain